MSDLTAAAFGAAPSLWPLPAARTDEQRWLRAVAAGGQGRYATAFAELAELRRTAGAPLVSLSHSTQASLLRQLGWHDRARDWDGRALARAGTDPQARADALVGLAADAPPLSGTSRRLMTLPVRGSSSQMWPVPVVFW